MVVAGAGSDNLGRRVFGDTIGGRAIFGFALLTARLRVEPDKILDWLPGTRRMAHRMPPLIGGLNAWSRAAFLNAATTIIQGPLNQAFRHH